MHELSVCQALIGQVEQIAAERTADQVLSITVQIGPLSGVEPKLLENAYSIAAAGSIADGAELILEMLPIRVHCDTCGADSDAQANRLVCAECGDWHTRLLSGDELLLASLELQRD